MGIVDMLIEGRWFLGRKSRSVNNSSGGRTTGAQIRQNQILWPSYLSSISLAYPQSGDSGMVMTGGGDAGGGGE